MSLPLQFLQKLSLAAICLSASLGRVHAETPTLERPGKLIEQSASNLMAQYGRYVMNLEDGRVLTGVYLTAVADQLLFWDAQANPFIVEASEVVASCRHDDRHVLALYDGRVLVGNLLASTSPGRLLFARPDGRVFDLSRADIEEFSTN